MKNHEPLNHSSQCVQQWKESFAKNRIRGTYEGELFYEVMKELERAPKFFLPEGGRPIEDQNAISKMFSELRMPFPVTALEYRVEKGPIADHEGKTTKRIALIWDLRFGVPHEIAKINGMNVTPRKSLLVQSIAQMDDLQMWFPVLGQVEVVMDGNLNKSSIKEFSEMDPQLYERVKHRIEDAQKHVNAYPCQAYVCSPELVKSKGAECFDIISSDSSDEVMAAISFGAITACSNVSFETIAVDKKMNERRIKQGKSELYDMRFLEVKSGSYISKDHQKSSTGAGHASPKAHLRRGHVRRLEEKVVWVNAAMVNADKLMHSDSPSSHTPSYSVSQRG